eukprot:1192530-Prorocentrum_minimum.AAC.3
MKTRKTRLYFEDGELVLKQTKRHLEDEFVDDKQPDAGGFLIPNDDFNEFEVTTKTYKPKSFITLYNNNNNNNNNYNNNDLTSSSTRLSALQTQQKYALFARASYFEGDTKQIRKLFDNVPGLSNFKLDKELSTKKNSVFVDNITGEVVISYKGTNPTNFEDLYDDLQIIRSQENHTSRFKQAENLYTSVKNKYGKNNIKIVGHSLGGAIAMHVGEANDIETHSFNPGISALRTLESHTRNTNKSYVYRTQNDPVSIGSRLNQDKNRKIIVVPQKDLIDSHSIDNFYKTKHIKTLEDIDNDISKQMMKLFGLGAKTLVKEQFSEEIDLMNSTKPMSDAEAHAIGLDKVANALKSSKRRDQDRLMELADSQVKSDDIITDIDGDIVSKGGVRYVQVSGGAN